jgi:hypothetical protein
VKDFERSLVPLLVREFERKQPVFQVLTGPRQVGKTTIAQKVMDKLPFPCVYASADSPLPPGPEWIETQWRRAEVEADRSGGVVLLVLDEVQKVRGWSESLKSWRGRLIENAVGGHLINNLYRSIIRSPTGVRVTRRSISSLPAERNSLQLK